jgi:hypothetical protein
MTDSLDITHLPAGDLIAAGLRDLASGTERIAALLVSIGAHRLRRAGLDVPAAYSEPEERLYAVFARVDSDTAHARYNALVRRLVSFERAAERGSPVYESK